MTLNENNIEIIVVKDAKEGGKKAAEIVQKELENGLKVIGLPTGGTPETMYEEIQKSDLDFSDVVAINLDEYVGLAADHPQSYAYFMKEHLFDHKPFKETHVPDGLAPEAEETARYDQILADNPIDLQILGIGTNAHIGFNEPGSGFDDTTRKVDLTESTIESNQRYFDSVDQVPRTAYSMGMGSIMEAKKILLIAYGENKAEAIAKTVNGEITKEVPASILQKHDNIVFVIDEAAASKL